MGLALPPSTYHSTKYFHSFSIGERYLLNVVDIVKTFDTAKQFGTQYIREVVIEPFCF